MGSSNTEGYTSLVPFVRYEIDDGFIEARWRLSLDAPYGWSFDSGGPAGSDIIHG